MSSVFDCWLLHFIHSYQKWLLGVRGRFAYVGVVSGGEVERLLSRSLGSGREWLVDDASDS